MDNMSKFIVRVYNFYNTQKCLNTPTEERLSIQCYFDADQTISSFWNRLLGKKFSEKVKSRLNIG